MRHEMVAAYMQELLKRHSESAKIWHKLLGLSGIWGFRVQVRFIHLAHLTDGELAPSRRCSGESWAFLSPRPEGKEGNRLPESSQLFHVGSLVPELVVRSRLP